MASLRRPGFVPLITVITLLGACATDDTSGPGPDPHTSPDTTQPPPPPRNVVVVATGDMVCGGPPATPRECLHGVTAGLAAALSPQAVLVLGDLQYEQGELANFQAYYHPTWGALKSITYPVPGNHEYETPRASGYFDYFNGMGVDSGRAGHRDRGWYAFTLGAWHVIALNSNCPQAGGCGAGSPQEQWLRATLAANTAKCTLAYWHHPRFSAAGASDTSVTALWKALEDDAADLILTAHTHNYERYAPLTSVGAVDGARGIPSFIVGTGGRSVHMTPRTQVGLQAIDGRTFGVLRLVLKDGGFDWEFRSEPGSTFTDAGSASCH